MTRKVLILAMLFATTFLALPFDANAAVSNRESNNSVNTGTVPQEWRRERRRWRRWNNRRYRNTYGYRNYGQYRRTQVGNRRYRMVRRYYWNDGVRLSRYVRVYY